MDNHEEMGKFLEGYSFPRLNQQELENIKRSITSNETETGIKNLPTNKKTKQIAANFPNLGKETVIQV